MGFFLRTFNHSTIIMSILNIWKRPIKFRQRKKNATFQAKKTLRFGGAWKREM